jgi:hypothetical protein
MFIFTAIINLVNHIRVLPKTIANAAKRRKQQLLLNDREAERLDRIRNPWKYLGK